MVLASLAMGASVLLAGACGPAGGLTGTGTGTGAGAGEGICVSEAMLSGHRFNGVATQFDAAEGRALGRAIIPPCPEGDGGGGDDGTPIEVAAIEGVAPADAFVQRGQDDVVFIRDGLEPLPPELARLMDAPACDPADEPIRLSGPWLGIMGPDESTETDLVPPYDLEMVAAEASSPAYLRAHLVVRVPRGRSRPITRQDVEAALWKPGTMTVVAGCGGPGFVAREVSVAAVP